MLGSIARLGLPWLQWPVLVNAPMSGVAGSRLAVAVTCAGGLGQIGFTGDADAFDEELATAKLQLQNRKLKNQTCDDHILPIGAGIIVFGTPIEEFIPVIAKHTPAVVWLSFATAVEFQRWTTRIRQASPLTKVWIQVGSATAALEAAHHCRPDALVLQGSDAGGHGHESGASIIPLIPEVTDVLHNEGLVDIPLIAAGGIMDGRGTAAALALGALGVVMGTRFLGAEEAKVPPEFRKAIFESWDGAESTARSTAFDAMWGPNPWPELYNGRCLKNLIYENVKDGLSEEAARIQLHHYLRSRSLQDIPAKDMMSIWAGTGVGLVREIEKAADIVDGVRNSAQKTIMTLSKTMTEAIGCN
ncbi:hypothetical protein NQ176_g3064 [Zarea fungicola]|uniref:Uncharacterized protein n=1 Tax=Zarea fungicola TaxID=93591 RepID=A0ACC1NLD7_9HYPO|nr:hypothetical protein NQ176_g3064 [Lecanicillium fungicola]